MLAWTLVAFGGAYPWVLVVSAAILLAAARSARPRIFPDGSRALDLFLAGCLLCPLLQLVPLPEAARRALSPHAADVDVALRLDAVSGPRPLSVDPASTAGAAAVATLALLAFFTTRTALRHGGVRTIARTVAWTGLAVSVIAIVVRASSTLMIYGFWATGYDVEPYGPFVNRNHMGSWLVMALPLVVGYIFARSDRIGRERNPAAGIDAMMIWLAAAAAAMLAAGIVSLSRSTAVGIAVGGAFGSMMAFRRRVRGARWLVITALAASIGIAISIPRTVDLAERFRNAGTTATWDRPQIWRETLPIVRDFAATGTGVGTFYTAMLVYQQSDRMIFFNQAHDQYLQFAAEGGLLLMIPLTLAAIAFGAGVRARLRDDRSALFWIRVGAVAGILGVLAQSIWETGLRMPANGLLFAVLCAIAVHERSG